MVYSPQLGAPVRPDSIVDGVDRAVATVVEAAGLTRSLVGITTVDGMALADVIRHDVILEDAALMASMERSMRATEAHAA